MERNANGQSDQRRCPRVTRTDRKYGVVDKKIMPPTITYNLVVPIEVFRRIGMDVNTEKIQIPSLKSTKVSK
ncbi:hypothetical protein H5410_004537 [Solanum commersonii]|uniref:Uncharacterized protein n=1 Tax=Solanum commersonii TaxID=4109 RepID=A0A9J6B8E1_SOLCO|nr:hypothetical protein H5410_004537 [Solanum commersonii]